MSWTNEDLKHKIDSILYHSTRNPEELDTLLAFLSVGNKERVIDVVRNSWALNMVDRETWLTKAVFESDFEIIAILMSYGADPLKVCPLKDNLCAFDMLATHYHAQNRPRFHFLATLLNVGIPPNTTRGGFIARDDHLFGVSANAFLLELDPASGREFFRLDNADTPLAFAVKNYLPYCVRWLIYGREAAVDESHMNLLKVALECFPKRPPDTAHSIEHRLWAEKLEKWKMILSILCKAGVSISESEYLRWREQYGEAFKIYWSICLKNWP